MVNIDRCKRKLFEYCSIFWETITFENCCPTVLGHRHRDSDLELTRALSLATVTAEPEWKFQLSTWYLSGSSKRPPLPMHGELGVMAPIAAWGVMSQLLRRSPLNSLSWLSPWPAWPSDSSPVGRLRWLLLASPEWKTRLPTWPSLAWGRGAQFVQWYLAGVEHFLPESSLSWALFLILWLERTAFLSSTCLPPLLHLHLLCFPSCCLLQIWEIWSKAKTQGNHQGVIPWVLRSLANLPPSFSESYVSFIYNFQGF